MLNKNDLEKLNLIAKFLQTGTFTLRGADVSVFIECRIWLKDYIESGMKPPLPPKVEPTAKPIAKRLRKKKAK